MTKCILAALLIAVLVLLCALGLWPEEERE